MLPLYAVVAATADGGIGMAGRLPWPRLRREMDEFRRITQTTRFPGDAVPWDPLWA
jgi:dihydrofolate reductase